MEKEVKITVQDVQNAHARVIAKLRACPMVLADHDEAKADMELIGLVLGEFIAKNAQKAPASPKALETVNGARKKR